MAEFFKKRYHLVFFGAFLALWAATLAGVSQFGDDYYYMTFFSGGFKRFIELNASHYAQVNGRALVHLVDEILLADRGLWLWRIAELCVIGSTVWLSARAAAGGRKDGGFPAALVIFCALFSLIGVKVHAQTYLWATGAMNYALPVPVMLSYFLTYKNFTRTKKLPRAAFVLAFVSCALIEQCAFASLIVTALILCEYLSEKKKFDAPLFLCLIFSVAGMAFLFLAPGNFVRKTYYPEFYETPLFLRVLSNVKPILRLILSSAGDVIAVYLLSGGVRRLVLKERARAFSTVCFAAALCVLLHVHVGETPVITHLAVILSFAVFAFDAALEVKNFVRGERDGLFFIATPVLLQAAMLISPIYGERTVLVSAVMMLVPAAKNIIRTKDGLTPLLSGGAQRAAAISATVVLLVLVAARQIPMIAGYAQNKKIYDINEQNAAECVANGDAEMTFYRAKNNICRYTLPYDDPYHEYWFKVAHGMNPAVEFVYKDCEK